MKPAPTMPKRPSTTAVVSWLSLALAALAWACGPTTTEPMPDIPQTVDYDTVKFDYAGEDGVDRSQQASLHQALVGESSGLAEFTRKTVFGTNRMIYRVFRLIDAITAYPARRPRPGRWIWETPARADQYLYLQIDAVGETFEYTLRWGNSAQDNRQVFSGWFEPFDVDSDVQQGRGLLHLDFDAVHAYDPTSYQGKVAIAFRSRNQVRQVRVGFDEFTDGQKQPLSAIYRYVELPSGRGQLVFFGRGDFSKDGEPHEFLSVQSVWLADRQGRVAARVEGGSLARSYTVNQCWDQSETVVWEESQPNRPLHDGGSRDQCAASLRGLSVEAPTYEPPNGEDPQVPEAHPTE